jgi:hypothetical protein
VKAGERRAFNSWNPKSTKDTDVATGETLWFVLIWSKGMG